jgi:hypothetical protein
MRDRQLELGFGNMRKCRSGSSRHRRRSRGYEWFARMRQVVESVPDTEEKREHDAQRDEPGVPQRQQH